MIITREVTAAAGGTLLDQTLGVGEPSVDILYASASAPGGAKVQVFFTRVGQTEKRIDVVFLGNGGSHSWWHQAGGGLVRGPIREGDRLRIICDKPAAMRFDFGDDESVG